MNGTDEPEAKPINDRQRKFCDLIVSGRPAGRAYEEAGYSARAAAADSCAEKLLRKAEVQEYLASIRKTAEEASGMTKDAAVKRLVDTLLSKPSEANMDNPLCELKMSKAGPYAAFPDKSRTMEQLTKMLGWNEPEEIDVNFEVVIGGNQDH